MNNNENQTNVEKILYAADTYARPDFEGTFRARLEDTAWPRKSRFPMLICYFTLEDGRGISLLAVRSQKTLGYSPNHTDIDFKYVEEGTWWDITIRKTKSGYCTWDKAEPVQG